MLKSPAQTFRSRARLAVGLSWVAGYTNVIMLLAAEQTISHQTGNTTHVGEQVGDAIGGHRAAVVDGAYFAALVGCFGAGAFLSGLMTGTLRRGHQRSRFVLPMTVEAILLSVVVLLLARYPQPTGGWPQVAVTCMAALAMGLQNATITRISGAVVRTTHLTGVITDLGLELSQLVAAALGHTGRRSWRHARRHPGWPRVALLGAIFTSFLTGAVLGSVSYQLPHVGASALLLPVLFLTALVVREQTAAVAEIHEVEPPTELTDVVPGTVGLYRLAHRAGQPDHPPDFAAWAERLPPRWRVVILSVDPLTRFHADAAIGLLTAAGLLRADGRSLLVAGLRRSELQLLRRHDPHHRIKYADFPPDLEFAVARALNLLADDDAAGRVDG
jgi:uncharacterized membrane protein YoaK (UPF0700 family)